jgi:hypothetical protein
MLMQEPDIRGVFAKADAEPDLSFAGFAGTHSALEHLGAANRLEVIAF